VNDKGRQEDLSPRPGQLAERGKDLKDPAVINGIVPGRRAARRGTG